MDIEKSLHPGPGYKGSVDSKAVVSGRNSEHPSFRDDRYVRCSQCGFVCHLDRDARYSEGSRAGTGITPTNVVNQVADDPVVSSGCPLCGSYRYHV